MIEITEENSQIINSSYSDRKLLWIESSRVFNQPIRYYSMHGNTVKKTLAEYNLYTPGIVFIVLLAIGGIYGVFFKKEDYQEKRCAFYNIFLGCIIFLIYISTSNMAV